MEKTDHKIRKSHWSKSINTQKFCQSTDTTPDQPIPDLWQHDSHFSLNPLNENEGAKLIKSKSDQVHFCIPEEGYDRKPGGGGLVVPW